MKGPWAWFSYNFSTELKSLRFCRSALYTILYNVLITSNLKYICISFYITICFTYCRLAGVYMRNRKHGGKENETWNRILVPIKVDNAIYPQTHRHTRHKQTPTHSTHICRFVLYAEQSCCSSVFKGNVQRENRWNMASARLRYPTATVGVYFSFCVKLTSVSAKYSKINMRWIWSSRLVGDWWSVNGLAVILLVIGVGGDRWLISGALVIRAGGDRSLVIGAGGNWWRGAVIGDYYVKYAHLSPPDEWTVAGDHLSEAADVYSLAQLTVRGLPGVQDARLAPHLHAHRHRTRLRELLCIIRQLRRRWI